MLNTNSDSPGKITAIGVVPYLLAVAQNVQRILSLDQFLYQVGNYVRHGQAHIAAHDVLVRQCPLFANANTIERPHDGVRKLVLLKGTLDEILDRKLLETVGRAW